MAQVQFDFLDFFSCILNKTCYSVSENAPLILFPLKVVFIQNKSRLKVQPALLEYKYETNYYFPSQATLLVKTGPEFINFPAAV